MKARALVAALAASSALAVVAACTAFSDLGGPNGAATEAGGPDGGGGDGDGGDGLAGPGMLSLPDAMKVCSLVARCFALGEAINASLRLAVVEPSTSLCLTELATTLEPKRPGRALTARVLQELAGATSCGAAGAMLSLEPIAAGDPRCPDSGAAPPDRCLDGMTAIHCLEPGGVPYAGFLRHCGRPSRTSDESCFAFDGGAECAVGAGCTDPGCIGPVLDVCRPNDAVRLSHARTDCNVLGMQCIVGSNSDIGCSTTDEKTRGRAVGDGRLGAFCEGTRRVITSELYFATVDCAALGGTCEQRGLGAVCTLPGDACSPLDDVDTCTGTTLDACVGGRRVSFDCASIGKSCVASSGAGSYAAACL